MGKAPSELSKIIKKNWIEIRETRHSILVNEKSDNSNSNTELTERLYDH